MSYQAIAEAAAAIAAAAPPDGLAAAVTALPPAPAVTLTGQMDVTSSGYLVDLLMSLVRDDETVTLVVDIGDLVFADSMAVRALVQAARLLRHRGGTLTLLRPQYPLVQVLRLTGADRILDVRPGEPAPA